MGSMARIVQAGQRKCLNVITRQIPRSNLSAREEIVGGVAGSAPPTWRTLQLKICVAGSADRSIEVQDRCRCRGCMATGGQLRGRVPIKIIEVDSDRGQVIDR